MASASEISEAIINAASGLGLQSPSLSSIAIGVGVAVATWLPTGVLITAATAGTAGTGVCTGSLIVPTLPTAPAIFASHGMQGQMAPALATAISLGISTSLSGSSFSGPSAGVGIGAAQAKVTAVNLATLTPLVASTVPAALASQVVTSTQGQFTAGIAAIISAQILLGFGFGEVKGTPSPVPALGTAFCTLSSSL